MWQKVIASCLVLILSFGCASLGANFAPPASNPPQVVKDAALYVPRLADESLSLGHGCPVSPTEMLSAKHVLTRTLPDGSRVHKVVVWDDMKGHLGEIMIPDPGALAPNRDLVVGLSNVEFEKFFYYNREPLALGEKLYTVNFDFNRTEGIIFPNFIVESTYRGPFVGYLLMGGAPGFGASGSCVFNSKGEVVGIFVMFNETSKLGWAVDLSHPGVRPNRGQVAP